MTSSGLKRNRRHACDPSMTEAMLHAAPGKSQEWVRHLTVAHRASHIICRFQLKLCTSFSFLFCLMKPVSTDLIVFSMHPAPLHERKLCKHQTGEQVPANMGALASMPAIATSSSLSCQNDGAAACAQCM